MSQLLNNSQQEVDELYQVKPPPPTRALRTPLPGVMPPTTRRDGRADAPPPAPPQYFNEELDGMFDAANLPDDDAWAAMTRKVKEAQQGKVKAEHENSYVAS